MSMGIHTTTEEIANESKLGFKPVTKENLYNAHIISTTEKFKLEDIENMVFGGGWSLKAMALYITLAFILSDREIKEDLEWDGTISGLSKVLYEKEDDIKKAISELADGGAIILNKILPKASRRKAKPTYYFEIRW